MSNKNKHQKLLKSQSKKAVSAYDWSIKKTSKTLCLLTFGDSVRESYPILCYFRYKTILYFMINDNNNITCIKCSTHTHHKILRKNKLIISRPIDASKQSFYQNFNFITKCLPEYPNGII